MNWFWQPRATRRHRGTLLYGVVKMALLFAPKVG
jgi:hypothetical protein